MDRENIARVCHMVNRAYCRALGDDSQLPWEQAPEWQKESARRGVQLHLNDPIAGPRAGHEAWRRDKDADGWVYGPNKDEQIKTHPCMVPFEELPQHQQAKDFIFATLVRELKWL